MASGKRDQRHRVADILMRETEGIHLVSCACGLCLEAATADALSLAYSDHVGPRAPSSSYLGGRPMHIPNRPGERIA